MSTHPQLLHNVKILAFTQFLLGPAAVQYLADIGADVIKIEPPSRGSYERRWSGGQAYPGGVSAFFLLAHRNVRSLTLDLKSDEGRRIARQLAQQADVVVENFRPGIMDRFGLGYESLKHDKPDLIYAVASGYGSDNPHRDLPGQDILLQARTGLASVTGSADGPPVAAGAAIVDQHAAALLAMGILGALHHRRSTGHGQQLEVTMAQAALDLQTEPLLYYLNGGTVQRPQEPLGSSFHEAPYGFYTTRDGHVALSLSPINLISQALGNPPELEPFKDPAVSFTSREDIHRALTPLLHPYTTAELLATLGEHQVWCAPVNSYDTAWDDPVIDHVGATERIDHPEAGSVQTLKHPVRYGSGQQKPNRMPPCLGQHTSEILSELDYDATRIAEFRRKGVV